MGVKVKERDKGSGVWWIFINHNGRRKAKKVGKNKAAALDAAKKIEAKLTLGDMDIDEKNIPTFKEYINGWNDSNGEKIMGWYDKVAVLSLKNSTHKGYRVIIEKHLIPAFGKRRLNEITSGMISDYINQKVKDGLKSGTAKNIKNCLSKILSNAVNPDKYIKINEARNVTVPKPEDEGLPEEADPLTWEERTILEKAFYDHYRAYYPLVICGFRTGLRIGEIIGLKWSDIDFIKKLILVQRNVTRCKVTTPKSKAGTRFVRMSSQFVEILKQHKKAMAEKTLNKGWKEMPEWIFSNEIGNHLKYDNFIKRVWNNAMDKSELRRRTPHDMRHTYATLRLSKGNSLAEVSKEMGHGKADITYKTYYKWMPSESKSNIDELDYAPMQNTAKDGCAGVAK